MGEWCIGRGLSMVSMINNLSIINFVKECKLRVHFLAPTKKECGALTWNKKWIQGKVNMHKPRKNIVSANWSKNDAYKQTKGNLHTKHTTTWTWKDSLFFSL